MLQLDWAGNDAFDVFTKSNRFAGMVVKQPKGHWAVYFDSNAGRRSARKFKDAITALSFIYDRRIAKGFTVA